jgi:Tol biopolymer transport system component
VGVHDNTIWIHDSGGDRQLSLEGSAWGTNFSEDRSKLYYVMQSRQGRGADLWVREMASGKTERVASDSAILPGSTIEDYSVSHDDKQVAFSLKDQNGISRVWLSSTDHRSSPRELASAAGQDSPRFLPNGDLVLRSTEGGQNFLYRISQNGTERRKITPEPILDLFSASPDGRWWWHQPGNPMASSQLPPPPTPWTAVHPCAFANRIFSVSRMVFARGAASMMRWMRCRTRS